MSSVPDLDRRNAVLEGISLCTYSTGKDMVREVLDDWLQFLGGQPKETIFAISPTVGAPAIYEELYREGKIDRILGLEPNGRSVMEIEGEAVSQAVSAAATEWVLLIKLDTLPFRSGHADWLAEALEMIERHRLFGMTGSAGPDITQRPLVTGYCVTQKFSNNFSLFRKADWLDVINRAACPESSSNPAASAQFNGENRRYLNEYLVEEYLEKTGKKMLVRLESLEWSVSHVNVWGDALKKVRLSYLERAGVKRFLNTGRAIRRMPLHPWQKYYGFPPPPLLKRIRIDLGRWRRNLFGPRS